MPTYTYRCAQCGRVEDAVRRISERHQGPECHGVMNKVITPTEIQPVLGGGEFAGYQCPVTDTFITSRKQRREVMAKHDLIERG